MLAKRIPPHPDVPRNPLEGRTSGDETPAGRTRRESASSAYGASCEENGPPRSRAGDWRCVRSAGCELQDPTAGSSPDHDEVGADARGDVPAWKHRRRRQLFAMRRFTWVVVRIARALDWLLDAPLRDVVAAIATDAPASGPRKGRVRCGPQRPCLSGCCASLGFSSEVASQKIPIPVVRTLVERCYPVLVVGCMACERYVRLDAGASLPSSWRSLPVIRLGRLLRLRR